jgi:hypothetical protein
LIDEAEKVFLEVLSLGLQDHGPEVIDLCGSMESSYLGLLYMHKIKVDYAKREQYWRRVLDWYSTESVAKDMNNMTLLYMAVLPSLEMVLRQQHKWAATYRLYQDFPDWASHRGPRGFVLQNGESSD